MFSSVKMGDKTYINDVIVTPDGKMYKDWDMKEDKEFKTEVHFKPRSFCKRTWCFLLHCKQMGNG